MATRGKGFREFNYSLTSNAEYVQKLKNQNFENLLNQGKITDKYLRWDY